MPSFNRLVIAEKPTMAEDIAKAIAAMTGARPEKNTSEGCWVVGEDRVAWLYGHCYDSAPPEEYNPKWKNRDIEFLPIDVGFSDWKININKPPPTKDGRPPLNYEATVRRVSKLVSQATTVINSGDAGREGQLLVDELLNERGFDAWGPNTLRLWCSSLSKNDLIAALRVMKPNKEYYNVFLEARSRQIADWLYGLNLSRLYTALARQQGYDVNIRDGRVMTPILGMVVRRDLERANFKPVKFFGSVGHFKHENGEFKAKWQPPKGVAYLDAEGRVLDQNVIKELIAKTSGKSGTITSFQKTRKKTSQPLPFSLATLQILCSSRFHMSADETLAVAIKLYDEYKIASYPRTSSQYLNNALAEDIVPAAMKAVSSCSAFKSLASGVDLKIRSPAWNDSKVTDHHGLIPLGALTEEIYNKLPPDVKQVYDVIVQRFICQFYPPAEADQTVLTVLCEGETFVGRGSVPVSPGWRKVTGSADDDDEDNKEPEDIFPPMKNGDLVESIGAEQTSGETKKPPEFTDGTLIKACMTPYLHEPDPILRKKLKDGGYVIGTEATRAAIILKLLGMSGSDKNMKQTDKNPMLTRIGKSKIVSTEFGRSLIASYPEEEYSLGMTALWEAGLGAIGQGQVKPQIFLDRLMGTIRERIKDAPNIKLNLRGLHVIQPLPGNGEECPNCHKGKLVTREFIPKGKRTPERYLTCSLASKDGECDYVKFQEKEKPKPIAGDGQQCPKCHKGHLITREISKPGPNKGKKFLGCSEKECDFTKWPDPPPLPGTGDACPKCHKGKVVTRERKPKAGEKTSTDRRFQCCSIRECDYVKFQNSCPKKR